MWRLFSDVVLTQPLLQFVRFFVQVTFPVIRSLACAAGAPSRSLKIRTNVQKRFKSYAMKNLKSLGEI